MNTALWIAQVLLAVMFLVAGYMKAFQPLDTLAKSFKWTASTPPSLVRFIGVCELLGAIGIVFPPLTHILPWLAIAAAGGFILAAGGGAVLHITRREYPVIGFNIILVVLAAFVMYGRLALVSFQAN